MPKGIKISQDLKDKVLEEVALYQSEGKYTLKNSFKVLGEKYSINPDTINKWYYKSRGKNQVISQVAKKKDKAFKVAATSVSSSAQFDAEKIIFDYLKGLSTFKRILACICGFDKLCMHYGSKKMDKR